MVSSTETKGSDSVIKQLEWIHMWKDVQLPILTMI